MLCYNSVQLPLSLLKSTADDLSKVEAHFHINVNINSSNVMMCINICIVSLSLFQQSTSAATLTTLRKERWEEFLFLTTKKWLYFVARTTVLKGMTQANHPNLISLFCLYFQGSSSSRSSTQNYCQYALVVPHLLPFNSLRLHHHRDKMQHFDNLSHLPKENGTPFIFIFKSHCDHLLS